MSSRFRNLMSKRSNLDTIVLPSAGVDRSTYWLLLLLFAFLAGTASAQKATPDVNGGGGGGGTTVVPTISVSSSGSPSTYGNNVTFTGSITPESCASNAVAMFSDSGSAIGSATWSSTGTATVASSSLAVGTHSITVSFGGNKVGTTTCSAVTSTPLSQVINQATATISINNLPSAAVYGRSFIATYSYSGTGSPSESITSTTTSVCTTSGSTASFVGPGTCSLYASAQASGNYAAATGSVQSFTVSQATPTIAIADLPSSGVYGGSFTATYSYSGSGSPSETISSSTPGVCAVSGNTVNYVAAGTCTLTASASATTDYGAVTGGAQSFSIGSVTPVITWTQPAAISEGTALSTMQLDATANVPGTFAYTPAIGTVLSPGSQTLSVTFTPSNTTDYTSTSFTTTLVVNPPPPPCPVY